MRAVILQPHFLPFVGYFDLLKRADVFVFYDTVQFRRRSWHCRTWLSERGVGRWFSAPVSSDHGSRIPFSAARWADHLPWRADAARRLRNRYRHTPAPAVLEQVADLILAGPAGLADWNVRACLMLADAMGIRTATRRSSELPAVEGDKQLRLVRICQGLGADRYLCGPGSRGYVREEFFAGHGIRVEWLDYAYSHRVEGPGGDVFPSLLDLALDRGVARARQELGLSGGLP